MTSPSSGARPKRPTMVDVARHAGVSLKTVSRVVNAEPTVNPGLVERVLASVAALGFQRNRLASTLRAGRRTATIGLVIGELANPFYASIASVAAEVAARHDTVLITAGSEEDPETERRILADLCGRRVDGLLVVPAGGDHAFLRPEVEMGVPVVFLDRPSAGLDADAVLLDNRGGAEAAVAGLTAAGHRRVALLLDSVDVWTMAERLAGARAALGAVGGVEVLRTGVSDPGSAAAATRELLAAEVPPTAFFAFNNRITVGVLGELWRAGGDAALAGFDDFELADLMPRPLTVVAYDPRALARRAAGFLFDRIRGDRSPARREVLPTRLVERGRR